MIGDRVRWVPTNDPSRSGIVRAVGLRDGNWWALIQRADGSYGNELVTNLASVEPGSPTDVLERDLAEVQAELIVERERILRLRGYIVETGLEEAGTPALDDACGAAIDLLKTFQAELLEVGAARDRVVAELTTERDDARTERDEAVARLTSAYDIVKTERDTAVAEIESAKKAKQRNRGPERAV